MNKPSTLQIAIDAELFARQLCDFALRDQPNDDLLHVTLKALRIAASERVRRIQKAKQRSAQPP
jgi:hypothetical protein